MEKIGVFLAEGFEEIEALTVVDICRRCGLEAETVSVTEDRVVESSHGVGDTLCLCCRGVCRALRTWRPMRD